MLCTIYFQVVWKVNEKKRCERETEHKYGKLVYLNKVYLNVHCTILPTLQLPKISSVHMVGWGNCRTEREGEFTGYAQLIELGKNTVD